MKKVITLLAVAFSLAVNAQPRGKAKMLPVLTSGYYVNTKGDTLKGQVQVNPENPTDFYKQFAFKLQREKKPKIYTAQRVAAYGFDGRNFVMLELKGEKIFVERLVTGRLRFYEFQFNGKVNGEPAIESEYFVKDTGSEELELREPKKLSRTFYKQGLKPYLKDQAMLWTDLDKFSFDKNKVVKTLKEFNQFYASVGN